MAHDLLAKLFGQIDVIHQLTTEMMDLSKIESGQMPIKTVDTAFHFGGPNLSLSRCARSKRFSRGGAARGTWFSLAAAVTCSLY
jgi:hypothetical protein